MIPRSLFQGPVRLGLGDLTLLLLLLLLPPAPVPPAPPVPVPSDTSAQSLDAMVPILQSLHQGLCLVMQSIHNLAQHQPIIIKEEFIAQVAWPGVQPSPVEEGEAPTAQGLQPKPKATPEATPEETPEVTPAATPAEDTNYAVDMAVA